MAVNCSVAPLVIEGLAGVTAIEVRVGAVTVSLVFPLIEPKVAVIGRAPHCDARRQPFRGDGGHRGGPARPGHLGGDVGRRSYSE